MPDQIGKRISKSSTGGKDAKLTKANKHFSTALPDRSKEEVAEADAIERLQAAETRRMDRGNIQYGIDSMLACLALRREGKTIREIGGKRQVGRVKLPSYDELTAIQASNPEFHEQMRRARRDYERSIVEDGIQQIPKISKVRGLKGAAKSRALADHARVALQLGRQALPDDYSGDQEGEAEVIVMEVQGGWIPTQLSSGGPDQGADAAAARERWRKQQEEGKHGAR